jgi:hypothetical protein
LATGSKVDFTKFNRAMQAAIKEVESPATMVEIGQAAVDRIVKRTRLGKGVSESGADPQALKPLSPSYKLFRAGKIAFFTKGGRVIPYTPAKKPELSSLTSVGKSNATFTGQMLDAMQVVRARVGAVVLGFRGVRRNSRLSNEDVAGFYSRVRPFFFLSKPELNGMADIIRKRIQAALRKFQA